MAGVKAKASKAMSRLQMTQWTQAPRPGLQRGGCRSWTGQDRRVLSVRRQDRGLPALCSPPSRPHCPAPGPDRGNLWLPCPSSSLGAAPPLSSVDKRLRSGPSSLLTCLIGTRSSGSTCAQSPISPHMSRRATQRPGEGSLCRVGGRGAAQGTVLGIVSTQGDFPNPKPTTRRLELFLGLSTYPDARPHEAWAHTSTLRARKWRLRPVPSFPQGHQLPWMGPDPPQTSRL